MAPEQRQPTTKLQSLFLRLKEERETEHNAMCKVFEAMTTALDEGLSKIPAGKAYDKYAGTKTTTAFNRPSAEEAMKLKAEGKCFLCKEKGRIVKDCPKVAVVDEAARLNAIVERLHNGRKGNRVELLEESDNESAKN